MDALANVYRVTDMTRLALSVELENRAMALYSRLGFLELDRDDNASRMVKDL